MYTLIIIAAGFAAGLAVKYVYDWLEGPSDSKTGDSDTPSSESDDAPDKKRQKMA